MPKEMLINVSAGEECRIALLEDGRLEELYMERTSATSHVGNIYKGRVTNVERSIQAAFVDFGLGRNGFLHISDLMPSYFGQRGEDIQESVGRKLSRRDRPPIERCLRRGDQIVVQIIKEGIGTKGPTLTTYLSIPGKMLVMMPGMGKMGVSKKIEDEQERRRLRQILDSLSPPKDVAFIIRTAGVGKTKVEIERDLKYLTRLWEMLVKKEAEPAPVELYTEGDLVTRTVRDMFSPDVERIVVDNKDVAERVREVIKISSPRAKNRVDLYENPVPLFHQANIEREIEMMYSRHVPLPSGGSLVIDSTEAVVAIDVNSGKNRENSDAEMTAFRVDMEAADEIPRQLKLRDLGGVIICDFIDLRFERHRRELEERLFENFKNDRAKTKVLRMSQFGIIEITRQRMRPSLKRSIYADCPHCKGAGLIKTPESLNLDVMRKLAIALDDKRVVRIELSVCPDIAFYLLNTKRAALTELEARTQKKILIRTDAKLALDELRFELFDIRDGAVILEEIGMTLAPHPHTTQLGNRPAGHTAQGRGGRGGSGGGKGGRDDRNQNRKGGGRPLPTRPLDDDEEDDLEENLVIDRDEEDHDQVDRRGFEPNLEREEDPIDIPAVLETEAGDEIAEELADEDMGGGQHAEEDGDEEADEFEPQLPVMREPQRQPNRPPQNQNTGQQGNQNRNQNQNRPQQGNRPPQGQRNNDQRNGGQQNNDSRRNDQRSNEQRPNESRPNDQRSQPSRNQNQPNSNQRNENQNQNRSQGQFAGEQFRDEQGGGGRRRGRRGRRGRGGQGGQNQSNQNLNNPNQNTQNQNNRGNNNFRSNEPNGNVNPAARAYEGGYPEDQDIDYERGPDVADDSFNEAFKEEPNAGQQNDGQPNELPAGEGENQPPVRTDEGALGSDQKPRRRRRRGGRRHRRRNAEGQPINENPSANPSSDGVEGDGFDEGFDLENESAEAMDRYAPVAEPEPVEAPAPIAAVAEVIPEPEPVIEPKPKAKRGSRAKATGVTAKKAVRATAKRTPPKKSAKAAKEEKSEAAEVPPPKVVRTGSADKHLISDDEPVIPPPLSRPRSYSDLDAIPDDYD